MRKHMMFGGIALVLLLVVIYVIPWSQPVPPDGAGIESAGTGEMRQIEVPNTAFQAGTAPLGANEAETGYLHDDGHYYYNGKRVYRKGEAGEKIEFEFDADETDSVAVKELKMELVDEDGNPLNEAAQEALLNEVFGEE